MKENKKKSVIVAMSGGVDSSTTAYLLKKEGYEVIGMFMRLGIDSKVSENAARSVCNKLGIRFYPVNLAPQFKKEVINYFIESYKKGLTPNPCVNCNKLIKFKELLKIKDEIGVDFLATGHYIKKIKQKDKYKILKGDDPKKDQSYFLYNLTQKQLDNILFPLGEYEKEDVRKIADKAKLPYLTKESQDVCFMNQSGKIIEHNDFLKNYIKQTPGSIKIITSKQDKNLSLRGAERQSNLGDRVDKNKIATPHKCGARADSVIGEHKGLPFYTIGQRRGVEIGGTGPYYVVEKDFKTNTLYVVEDGDDKSLYSDSLIAENVNWVLGVEPKLPLECEAVIRYRHKAISCKVVKLKSKKYKVEFEKPQRAVTSGQSVVFYKIRRATTNSAHLNENNEYEVLGGGVIK